MTITPNQMILLLALVVGAIHVIGPDHWLPASILAWQKKWKTSKAIGFSLIAFSSHVFLGYLLFFVFLRGDQHPSYLLGFAIILMFSCSLLRRLRFSRVHEVFRGGSKGVWGGFAVLSLLGPCEIVLPLFVKARLMGMGYFAPFLAFLLGTSISGVFLVLYGRSLWNRPQWLPRIVDWAYEKITALPLLAGATLSLGFILI